MNKMNIKLCCLFISLKFESILLLQINTSIKEIFIFYMFTFEEHWSFVEFKQ